MPDPRRMSHLVKTFGTGVPAAIEAGEAAAQMTPTSPFSPGEPLRPFDGYSRTPRVRDYTPAYNVGARPRSFERIGFDTLKGLIGAYDVAQMCIWHRIDSIRSLDWSLVAAPHFNGDVSDAVRIGMAALKRPDRQTPFSTWLSAYLYDVLAYDAGTLFRLRNRRQDVIGLLNVDGTTIAPLQDYWGRPPEHPAPSHVQFANGLPWNWLTLKDLIYEPFRKKNDSPYGLAPLETILLNANTDIRFQVYFLERFTEGNIPQAFASAPESWTPDQIEQWQTLWDSFMAGDQAQKHTIRWMPGGSGITWSNEKDFTDQFSLFLMRKTAAAYHVVPSDLGFTETVNLSSSESQADVQHRVGDLPLIRHVQHVLSSFLQDDLGLPLEFLFDLGEEQADRLQQAQADQIYVQIGAISPSDVRNLRYGLEEPGGQPVPRFIYTQRGGPIPLASLYAVAGPVDPASGAPEPGTELPHTVFGGVEGVLPNPPIQVEPLAEQEFGPSAMPPAPPPQPMAPGAGPVEKDGEAAAPTAGITTATGITGYDLVGQHKDDDEDDEQTQKQIAKQEMQAFRRFAKGRRRKGTWVDFEFHAITPVQARRLNQAGRAAVRKDAGEIAVAGLAVLAADTGRVLMLQRALDPEDPAGGTFEFPGGHLEGDETPLMGAWREWSEETGCIPPPGVQTGSWVSGIYQGVVWTVDCEAMVPVRGDREIVNPDDPDGDQVEAIMWIDPDQLAGNPAVRPELLADLYAVLAALGCDADTDEATVEKASAGKGDAPAEGASQWPGWEADLEAANHWAPLIAAGLAGALTAAKARQLAADYLAEQSTSPDSADKDTLTVSAVAFLAAAGLDLATPLTGVLPGLYADGYLVGLTSAHAVMSGQRPDRGGWKPGDTATAQTLIGQAQASDGLAETLALAPGTATDTAQSRLRDLAGELVKGLLAGASAKEIAEALTGVLADTAKALALAVTEITRAAAAAAQYVYQQHDITLVSWLSEEDDRVCAACLGNEAAGPRPIGTPFPSGDVLPPLHPNCRCAVLPA